jgi:hypothetical protein
MADPIDWNELLAGGEGAANEALFGAPEWLIRKLGGGANLDAKIAQYKKAHDFGSTVGLVAGSLIPFGGIAKGAVGLGAKGARAGLEAARVGEAGLDAARIAKGADTALDLAKVAEGAGDVGKAAELADATKAAGTVTEAARPTVGLGKTLLDYGTRGAASGALEQGARGFFKDEDAAQIGQDVQQGIMFGGLGGAAGGALSKFAPQLAKLGKKATEKATIGLTDANTRQLLQSVQRLSGEGSGAISQVQKVDDIRREISDLIKSKKLYREGAVEAAAAGQSATWKKLDDIYEKTVGGQNGAQVLAGSLKPEDLSGLSSKYDPEILKEAMDKIMSPVAGRTGMANIRGKLEDMAKYARSGKEPNQEVADAMFDISKRIRGNLDEAVLRTAQGAGANIPPNFKREYGLLMPIAKGEVRSEIAPSKFHLGSPTFEKAAAASLLGGGSSLLGGPDEDISKKIERGVAGAALGFGGGKLLTQALRRGVSGADTLAALAEKAAPKIAENAGAIATTGARLAANTNRAVKEAAPTTEGEAEAAKEGADLGQAARPEYMSQVLANLTEYAKANGVEPDTQDFKDFIQTVGSATIGEDGSPFDAAKLSGMFYPDPEERAKFNRALEVSRGLASNLGTALKSAGGALGIGENPETKIEKTAALDKLAEVVGNAAKASGGTEAAAKKMLATIINSRTSQTEKRKMIQAMMENYGVDFSTLGRVGLNV